MKSFLLFFVFLIVDQLSKNLFKSSVDFGVIAITPITNTGISFGLFQGNNDLFILVSALFIMLLIFFRKEFKEHKIPWVMVLAGATGNLLDRIIHGHVLDFIDFKFFPVFNVADSLIFLGVAVIIIKEIKSVLEKATGSKKKI